MRDSNSSGILSLRSPELLSAVRLRSPLLQTSFVQAAGHTATGLSGFAAFHPAAERKEVFSSLLQLKKSWGRALTSSSMGHEVPLGQKKAGEGAMWPGPGAHYPLQAMRGGLGTSQRQSHREGESVTHGGEEGSRETRLTQHFLIRVTRR